MTIQRWEPVREMLTLRNAMDRLFDDNFFRPVAVWNASERTLLPIDMFQTDKEVVVKASIPGYKPEEVEITLSGDTLTIKGETKEEKETKDSEYFVKERRYGSFTRTVTVPVEIQSDKSEATFEDGVLTLHMPKSEEIKPKQIKIKAAKEIESGK